MKWKQGGACIIVSGNKLFGMEPYFFSFSFFTAVNLDSVVIDLLMGMHLVLLLFLASLRLALSQDVEHGLILVEGIQAIAETDDNFICATIDWWPHDKCDYNYCPWGDSSAVNLVSILDLFVYNMA